MRPVYRGAQLRSRMKALRAAEPPFSRPVLERLGTEFVARADKVSSTEWVPLDVDVALSRAIFDVHGDAGSQRTSRESIVLSLHGPLLGTLARTALNLYGRDPARLFGLVPRGHNLIYRDAGFATVRTRAGAQESTIKFVDVPAMFFTPGYIAGIAGGLEGIFSFAQIPGAVEVTEVDPERQKIELVGQWDADAPVLSESERPRLEAES